MANSWCKYVLGLVAWFSYLVYYIFSYMNFNSWKFDFFDFSKTAVGQSRFTNFMHGVRIPDLIYAFIIFMDFAAGMNGFRRIACLNSTIQMSKDKKNWPNSIVLRIRKVCTHFFFFRNVVVYVFHYLISLYSASIEAKETRHAYSIQR